MSAAGDRTLYLLDANDTVYLAEEVDPRHMPTVGPLYRLTALPAEPVDILAATKAALAATRAYLSASASASSGAAARLHSGDADGVSGREPGTPAAESQAGDSASQTDHRPGPLNPRAAYRPNDVGQNGR